jgi:hypothetical protein
MAIVITIGGFVATVDPYWLWRERVQWRYNLAMENRMRFAKSLQILFRQPEIVLLGSSVVYRGMNPSDIQGHRAYNLGISSLRIREAEAYVRHLLRWVKPKQIVLGVDYFAFDSRVPVESGFDPGLPDLGYLAKAGISAFVSASALGDAWRLVHKSADDPDGMWHRNGFKTTRPRTREEVAATLKMTRAFFSKTKVARSEFSALANIIELTKQANVELLLFVPPYHRSWTDALRQAVRTGLDFDQWMDELAQLARRHRIELWDFTTANPVAEAPVGVGSDHYLDPSHFSPLLGRWILNRLDLSVGVPSEAPPDGFGVRLSEPRKVIVPTYRP